MQTFLASSGDFACCVASPKGKFVYGVSRSDSVLYCFDVESGKVEHVMKLHAREVVSLCHHPHKNIIASCSEDGTLKLWKPKRK